MKRIHLPLVSAALTVSIALLTFSCGKNHGRKAGIPELPVLQPPAQPKAPTMIGADTIWDFSGQLPVLPGNEEALFTYIGKNLRYPTAAAKQGIQGKVLVRFCVTSKGDVTGYEVISSIDSSLDAEAMRVLRSIKRFEPGYQGGEPVAVWYQVPITFRLQ